MSKRGGYRRPWECRRAIKVSHETYRLAGQYRPDLFDERWQTPKPAPAPPKPIEDEKK